MRKQIAATAMMALAACATGSAVAPPIVQLAPSSEVTRETLLALDAVCSAEEKDSSAPAKKLRLAAGMGTGGFAVDSKSKDAQDWFDYGLALSHAFYHLDAKAAMKRAVEADPQCSMCQWGLAWALGPTLNYGIDDEDRIAALAAAEAAKKRAKPGDAKAAALANAIIGRYQKDTRDAEHDFGFAMAKIAADYPDDTEIAVLAAHTLLIPVRADDERGLKPALALIESVLKVRPDDTGAIHYYIHATEFDDRAEDALRYAERLGRLAPAASHLVHMPAHTLFHAGRYEEAAVANAKAIEADIDWIRAGGDPSAPGAEASQPPMYYAHNLAFGLAGALMSGDAQLALKYASHAQLVWPNASTGGTPVPRTYVALARYAPDQALQIPDIKGDPKFAIYRHYARGEAMLLRGDAKGAREEIWALAKIPGAGSAPENLIARAVLEGRLAMAEGRMSKAAQLFEDAAKIQETRLSGYMDPPQWWYPVRRSVAAAWLKAGDYKRAKAEAEKSLTAWKHDPLALWVLGKAEAGLGQESDSAAHLDEARKVWRGAFDSITADAI